MNAEEIKNKAAETMSNAKEKVEAIASDERVQKAKASKNVIMSNFKGMHLRWKAKVAAAFMVAFGAFAEETTNSVNDVAENEARIKVLRGQLAAAPLPPKLGDCVAATSAIEKRKSILDELYLLTDDKTIDMEYEIAEMYAEAIHHFSVIRTSLGQIKKELDVVRSKRVYDEKGLKEMLEKLDGIEITQPLMMAQHEMEELAVLDLSDIPLYHANIIKKEIGALDIEVRSYGSKIEALKANLLIDFVENRAVELTGGRTYSEKLAKLEKQGRILSMYINQITDPDAASRVLDLQVEILKKTRQAEKDRLKAYQRKALGQFNKAIDDWDGKHGDWPVRILEGLSEIDRAVLVPEMEEIYRDLWDRAINEYDKRVQDEYQFKKKARFLLELSEHEKWKLESL